MLLAYNYPILDIFWSMFMFFAFFVWIWVLVTVFIDIFRSPDMGGFAKALWFFFVLFIPLLGVIVYLIARGHKMHEHAQQAAEAQDAAFRQYVREAAGSDSDGSAADQLAKLDDLAKRGVITPEEFQQEKAKVLSSQGS